MLKWAWFALKDDRQEIRRDVQVLMVDEEASQGSTETLKGDQEAFEGNREALKGNGRLKERRESPTTRR